MFKAVTAAWLEVKKKIGRQLALKRLKYLSDFDSAAALCMLGHSDRRRQTKKPMSQSKQNFVLIVGPSVQKGS